MSRKYSFVKKDVKEEHGMRNKTNMRGGALAPSLKNIIVRTSDGTVKPSYQIRNNYELDYVIYALMLEIANTLKGNVDRLKDKIFVDFVKAVLELADDVVASRAAKNDDYSSTSFGMDYNDGMQKKIRIKPAPTNSPFAGDEVSVFEILKNDFSNYFSEYNDQASPTYDYTFSFVTGGAAIPCNNANTFAYGNEEVTQTPFLFAFYLGDADGIGGFTKLPAAIQNIENLRDRINRGDREPLSTAATTGVSDPFTERERAARIKGMAELRDKLVTGDLFNSFSTIHKSVEDIIGALSTITKNVYTRETLSVMTPDIFSMFENIKLDKSGIDVALGIVNDTNSDFTTNKKEKEDAAKAAAAAAASRPMTSEDLAKSLGAPSVPVGSVETSAKEAFTFASENIDFEESSYALLTNRIFRHFALTYPDQMTIAALKETDRNNNTTAMAAEADAVMGRFFRVAGARGPVYRTKYKGHGGFWTEKPKYRFKIMDNYTSPQHGGNSDIKDVNDYEKVLETNEKSLEKIKEDLEMFDKINESQNTSFFDNDRVYDLKIVEARNQILIKNLEMYLVRMALTSAGLETDANIGGEILKKMGELTTHLDASMIALHKRVINPSSIDQIMNLASSTSLVISDIESKFSSNSFVNVDGNPLLISEIPDQPVLNMFPFLRTVKQLKDTYGDPGITDKLYKMVDTGVALPALGPTTETLGKQLTSFYEQMRNLTTKENVNRDSLNSDIVVTTKIKEYTGDIIKNNLEMLSAFIRNITIFSNIYSSKISMLKEIKQMTNRRKIRLDKVTSLMHNMILDVKTVEPKSRPSTGGGSSELATIDANVNGNAALFTKTRYDIASIFDEVNDAVTKNSDSIKNMNSTQDIDKGIFKINKDLETIGTLLDDICYASQYVFDPTTGYTKQHQLQVSVFTGKVSMDIQTETTEIINLIRIKFDFLGDLTALSGVGAENFLEKTYAANVGDLIDLCANITNDLFDKTHYFSDVAKINVPNLIQSIFSIVNAENIMNASKLLSLALLMIADNRSSDDAIRKQISKVINMIDNYLDMNLRLNSRVSVEPAKTKLNNIKKDILTDWETFIFNKTYDVTTMGNMQTDFNTRLTSVPDGIDNLTGQKTVIDADIQTQFEAAINLIRDQWKTRTGRNNNDFFAEVKKEMLTFIASGVENLYKKLRTAYTTIASMATLGGIPKAESQLMADRQKKVVALGPAINIMSDFDSYTGMTDIPAIAGGTNPPNLVERVNALLEKSEHIVVWLRLILNKLDNGEVVNWNAGGGDFYARTTLKAAVFNKAIPTGGVADLSQTHTKARATTDTNRQVDSYYTGVPDTEFPAGNSVEIKSYLKVKYGDIHALTMTDTSAQIIHNQPIQKNQIEKLLEQFETVRIKKNSQKMVEAMESVAREFLTLEAAGKNLYADPKTTLTVSDGNQLKLNMLNLASIMKEFSRQVNNTDYILPHLRKLIPPLATDYYDQFIDSLERLTFSTTVENFAKTLARAFNGLFRVYMLTQNMLDGFVEKMVSVDTDNMGRTNTNTLINHIRNISATLYGGANIRASITDNTAKIHGFLKLFRTDYMDVLKLLTDQYQDLKNKAALQKVDLTSVKTPHFTNRLLEYKDVSNFSRKFAHILMRSKNKIEPIKWDQIMEAIGLLQQYSTQVSAQLNLSFIDTLIALYTSTAVGGKLHWVLTENPPFTLVKIKEYVVNDFLLTIHNYFGVSADAKNLSRACKEMPCYSKAHDNGHPNTSIDSRLHTATLYRRLVFHKIFSQNPVAPFSDIAVTNEAILFAGTKTDYYGDYDPPAQARVTLGRILQQTTDNFDKILRSYLKKIKESIDRGAIEKWFKKLIPITISWYIRYMYAPYVNVYLRLRKDLQKQVSEIVKELDIDDENKFEFLLNSPDITEATENTFVDLIAREVFPKNETALSPIVPDAPDPLNISLPVTIPIIPPHNPLTDPNNDFAKSRKVTDHISSTAGKDAEKLQLLVYNYMGANANDPANTDMLDKIVSVSDSLLKRYNNDLYDVLKKEDDLGKELNYLDISVYHGLKNDKNTINSRMKQLKTLYQTVAVFTDNKFYKTVDFVNPDDLRASVSEMLESRSAIGELDREKIIETRKEKQDHDLAKQQMVSYNTFVSIMGKTVGKNPPGYDPIFDTKQRYTRMAFGLIEFYYDIIVSVVECLESKSHVLMNRIELEMYTKYYIQLKRCQKVFGWIVKKYLPQKLAEEDEKKRSGVTIDDKEIVLRKKIYLSKLAGDFKSTFKMFNALKDLLDDWRSAAMAKVSIHVRINDFNKGLDTSDPNPKFKEYDPKTTDYQNHRDGLIFSVDRNESKKLRVNLPAGDHYFTPAQRGESIDDAYPSISKAMTPPNNGIDVERIYDPVDFPEADIISNYMSLAANIKNGKGTCIMTYGYSGVGKTASLFGSGSSKGILQTTLDQLDGNDIYLRVFEIYGLGTSHNFYWNPETDLGQKETYPENIYQFIIHHQLDTSANIIKVVDRVILDNRSDMFSYIGNIQNPSSGNQVHIRKPIQPAMETVWGAATDSTKWSDTTDHKIYQDSTYKQVTRDHYVAFDKFIDDIDKKREKSPITMNKYKSHPLTQVKSTVNNPVSSRSILVYDFQIRIGTGSNSYFVPFVIYDLPGKEDLYRTFVEPGAAKVADLEDQATKMPLLADKLTNQAKAVLNDLLGDHHTVPMGGGHVTLKPTKASLVMNPFSLADIDFDIHFNSHKTTILGINFGNGGVNETDFVNHILSLHSFPNKVTNAIRPYLIEKELVPVSIGEMFTSPPTSVVDLFNEGNLKSEVSTAELRSTVASNAGNRKYGIISLGLSNIEPSPKTSVNVLIYRKIFIAIITTLINYKMFDVLTEMIKTVAVPKSVLMGSPAKYNWDLTNIYSPFEAFFINENVVGLLNYLITEILYPGMDMKPFKSQNDSKKLEVYTQEQDFYGLKKFISIMIKIFSGSLDTFNLPGVKMDPNWLKVDPDDPRKKQKEDFVNAVITAFNIDKASGRFIMTGKTLTLVYDSLLAVEDVKNRLVYDNNKIFRNAKSDLETAPTDIMNDKGVLVREKNYPLIRDFLEPYRPKTDLYYLFFVVSNMQRKLKSEEQIKLVENSMPFITALSNKTSTGQKKTSCVSTLVSP